MGTGGVDTDGPNLVVGECIAARLNLALTRVEMRHPTLGVGYPEFVAIGRNVYAVDQVLGREKFPGLASGE
jgi:hypothetical protein